MGLKDTSYCVESKWATRIYCTAMGNITYFIIALITLKSKKYESLFFISKTNIIHSLYFNKIKENIAQCLL